MKNLLLTLGHNSSAIMIEDNQILWGWETERRTGVKSDSTMPPVADLVSDVDMAYVTHWSPDGQLNSNSPKHWRPEMLNSVPIRTLSYDVSHHDTHMAGAMCYAGPHFPYGLSTYGLVIDGFGTLGEHLSVYNLTGPDRMKLVRRIHGYGTSLGLWYQYATAFMGMKMHEDEYKLLGYEVHVPDELVEDLTTWAAAEAYQWSDEMQASLYGSRYDPLYKLEALTNLKEHVFNRLSKVCELCHISDPSSFGGRAALAYFVQTVLELVVMDLLGDLPEAKNLIVAGGVFYNVKLNHKLLCHVAGKSGQLCVYPLAGDQGNALGLYYMDHPNFRFPTNLNWGRRELTSLGMVEGLYVVNNDARAESIILDELAHNGCVNLVRGSMEFGPRALCNTSTLAMPTREVVSKINAANNRNTVMPMAPVMTHAMYTKLFRHTGSVWKSNAHMIVAMEYTDRLYEGMMGVAHWYTRPTKYATGRPQVISDGDWLMMKLLNHLKHPLINTSFNYHGKPIAYTMDSVIENHRLQHKRDPSIKTVVIQNAF